MPKKIPSSQENGAILKALETFVAYCQRLEGDEKGEAQVFLDRLFIAFGHLGYKEAGASLEHRVRRDAKTSFIDLLWPGKAIIEMKKRGERLSKHRQQAFDYWYKCTVGRPRFIVLCNFDEFWIFDTTKDMDEPMDKILLRDLPKHYPTLNFLFSGNHEPIWNLDRVEVTKIAASKIAQIFRKLVARNIPESIAQRFLLQCVLAMFAEDFDLLNRGQFTELVDLCRCAKGSTYDLLGGLFRQMNDPKAASGGRYSSVRYFNGGLFSTIDPIELNGDEIELLYDSCANQDWSHVKPDIFGTLFQESMDSKIRHQQGAHYTSQADIQLVVRPTIVLPWNAQIKSASSISELKNLREKLRTFKVLDPACGSGNFLYVAYREVKRIEQDILYKMRELSESKTPDSFGDMSMVSLHQFYGIDNSTFAVELAKVTMMLAKELSLKENEGLRRTAQQDLSFAMESALPLDNLDKNIVRADALFEEWPRVDAIIGNPPFQSKNKIQKELGRVYVNRLRKAHPDVSGRADFCVYWFRKAHDHLDKMGRAGLVGTKTIKQNESRESGLDHIVANGGTIIEAVSQKPWSGDAAVHVSIVNWVKGPISGKKRILSIGENGQLFPIMVDSIPSTLSSGVDVSQAKDIIVNKKPKCIFQGQTHGHEGFLMPVEDARKILNKHPDFRKALYPFLIGDDLLDQGKPQRFVIDLPDDQFEAKSYSDLYAKVENSVLKDRKMAAEFERKENEKLIADDPQAKGNAHHEGFLRRWWQLSYPRHDLMERIKALSRYVVCVRVTKRPIFEFISNEVHPNDALQVFPFEDDYSFGILQSSVHWEWFCSRCSTLEERWRYTSETVFNSFPWPQSPTKRMINDVARASKKLRDQRNLLMNKYGIGLRKLYQTLETPGENPLKITISELNLAVRSCYGMSSKSDAVDFLYKLNESIFNNADAIGPGLPKNYDASEFVTEDSVKP